MPACLLEQFDALAKCNYKFNCVMSQLFASFDLIVHCSLIMQIDCQHESVCLKNSYKIFCLYKVRDLKHTCIILVNCMFVTCLDNCATTMLKQQLFTFIFASNLLQ